MAEMKIDDYGGWPRTSEQMMKSKTHTKEYKSAEGAGEIRNYPDTTEEIKRDQDHGIGKAKGRPMKPGYRN